MCKKRLWIPAICLVLLTGTIAYGQNRPEAQNTDFPALDFDRIAVMPFLTGQLEAPDNPIAKPLSLPLAELHTGSHNLADKAEQVMTRLVHSYLDVRYRGQVAAPHSAAAVHTQIQQDTTLDTPRKLAVQFGKHLQADLVLVGSVWRFRERGTNMAGQDSPASVAFSVYLVEVESGKRLWRGAFDGTQKVLSEDVLGGLKQAKIGLRWISATELARLGVKQVFKKFPLP